MTFVSYAQNFEDVLLWRALHDVEHGTYIDIGAQDPELDSVSLAFYEAGWRGIHVEPTPYYAAKLREARPDETVIEAAVTDAAGPIAFYELGGLSSGREDIARHHAKSGHQPREIVVPTVGLDNLLELRDGEIHWLKIDVEGMEADVLRSWRDSPRRPWVLVIESTFPNSEEPTQHLWIDEVLKRGYKEALFDGLSRYFVHEAHADRAEKLNRPANVFDSYQITPRHFSAAAVTEQADARQQAAEAREAKLGEHLGEVRDRLCGAELELEGERAAHALTRRDAATEIGDAKSRLEAAQSELSTEQARLEDATVRQRENAEQMAKLATELKNEQAARAARDSEIRKIARLAGADLLPGAVYAAIRSRLALAEKERDLLREHAERQYAAGHGARDAEVSFLNERMEALQAEIAEARARLAQFEAAYGSARDRAERADARSSELQSRLDQQVRELAAVSADAAAFEQELAEARQELASIHASRAGRLATWFGLLPKPAEVRPMVTQANHQQSNEAAHAAPQHGMEIAVNDVRHVSNLLALNGASFVDALYRTFLKRAPDRSGRDHFIARLQAGHGKEAVLLAVATSREAQAMGTKLEGIDELQRDQARGRGWFNRRDHGLEERLNRLEYAIGEAHSGFVDRLDRIQSSVDQIQAGISAGGAIRAQADQSNGVSSRAVHSIKAGISIAPAKSAPEFMDALKSEVRSSAEAQSLRRN